MNTRLLNDAVLLKWIWRLIDLLEDNDLCRQLLTAKYLKKRNLLSSKKDSGSQFWRGLQAVKHMIRFGLSFKVQSGGSAMFWEDVWLKNIPLRLEYPSLFQSCSEKEALERDFWDGEECTIPFCRPLSTEDMGVWEHLMSELEGVNIHHNRDTPVWLLEKSGVWSDERDDPCATGVYHHH